MKDSDNTEAEEHQEDAYGLDRRRVAAILFAVERRDRETLLALMDPLHAADIADLLEQINAYDRGRLIRLYDREFDGEILSELDESIREEVMQVLNPAVLAEAVRDLAGRPAKQFTGGRPLKAHQVYENPLPTVKACGALLKLQMGGGGDMGAAAGGGAESVRGTMLSGGTYVGGADGVEGA